MSVTYDLLRKLGLTTVFGNPGSTEQTFLKNFPDDFTYVLALQEASALAIADGFAQSTGRPALVNLHTGAGTGNAMGSLIAAYKGNTPLIVTAGQQTREMVLCEPYLTNPEETLLPLPWVKWAYEPKRAEDVPAASCAPTRWPFSHRRARCSCLSRLTTGKSRRWARRWCRTVSHRVSPDAERLREFRRPDRPCAAARAGLRSRGRSQRGWDAGVAFAEKVGAPVYGGPLPDRASFPENHRLYRGLLPMTIAGVDEVLRGHDLV